MNKDKTNEVKLSIKYLWSAWKIVFSLALIGAMLFFVVSALIPPSYKALSTIAVNQSKTVGLDAYREAKSSEFIAQSVKEMISANSFMKAVLADKSISWTEMAKIKTQDERIKLWKKKVKVAVVPNTGVIHISVYTRNRDLSRKVNNKIIDVLKDKEAILFNKKGINLVVIDEPYYFYKPAFPNLAVNTILGFVIGGVLAVVMVSLNKDNQTNDSKPVINFNVGKKNSKYITFSSEELG